MKESLLQIRDYDGAGYRPLVDYGDWRVAVLRYLDEIRPDRIDSMERHVETDEVFVLLKGRGVLILGGNRARVNGLSFQPMEPGKVYNVRRHAWHSILLSREASVLLVENQDTGERNTEFSPLSESQQAEIRAIADQEGLS